ncbi:unnamed protein product [Ceutorhynchus assimilis]|uniref:Uncharacterized protein n=1 Tax=Ceutorhynchus assimilis TaxID=467358 RepID=A0A9N9QIW7_9CUCU|nr:unnamed protein product [Ceutorhynchus assimilis]
MDRQRFRAYCEPSSSEESEEENQDRFNKKKTEQEKNTVGPAESKDIAQNLNTPVKSTSTRADMLKYCGLNLTRPPSDPELIAASKKRLNDFFEQYAHFLDIPPTEASTSSVKPAASYSLSELEEELKKPVQNGSPNRTPAQNPNKINTPLTSSSDNFYKQLKSDWAKTFSDAVSPSFGKTVDFHWFSDEGESSGESEKSVEAGIPNRSPAQNPDESSSSITPSSPKPSTSSSITFVKNLNEPTEPAQESEKSVEGEVPNRSPAKSTYKIRAPITPLSPKPSTSGSITFFENLNEPTPSSPKPSTSGSVTFFKNLIEPREPAQESEKSVEGKSPNRSPAKSPVENPSDLITFVNNPKKRIKRALKEPQQDSFDAYLAYRHYKLCGPNFSKECFD